MTTAYIFSPATDHDWHDHPENASRATAVSRLLRREGILSDLLSLPPQQASELQLMEAHHPHMLEFVQQKCFRGGGMLDRDTYVTAASYEAARRAAGSVCLGVEAVMDGRADNGFVFVRPPGHHAEYRRPGGFCLINSAAVAARHLRRNLGVSRVLVLDFDVHHGNGTQDIFYEDDTVLFASIHQHGDFFYPGTGSVRETGRRHGRGYTLNVPLFPAVGDAGYARILEEVIRPKAVAFAPDFMLISAGYDAHWIDPLASIALSLGGYARMSQWLISLADEVCNGRILFALEGGYVHDALGYGVLNTLYALLGRDEIKDPLGPTQEEEPNIDALLSLIRGVHELD